MAPRKPELMTASDPALARETPSKLLLPMILRSVFSDQCGRRCRMIARRDAPDAIHTPYPIKKRGVNRGGRGFSMTQALREKAKLLNRVRRIRGLLDAIERALDEEKGCPEVLHLIAAARGGINGLMGEVIEDHIREHVVEPTKPSERFEGGEELIEAIQSYLK
jgi:DNA-binding FrmR family transcriptional regulator